MCAEPSSTGSLVSAGASALAEELLAGAGAGAATAGAGTAGCTVGAAESIIGISVSLNMSASLRKGDWFTCRILVPRSMTTIEERGDARMTFARIHFCFCTSLNLALVNLIVPHLIFRMVRTTHELERGSNILSKVFCLPHLQIAR